jgi:hypothetical protein
MVSTSHPDPHGPPDLTPIQVGEVWENPVTGERATILELSYMNPEGPATAELTALVGARAATLVVLIQAVPGGNVHSLLSGAAVEQEDAGVRAPAGEPL